MNSKRILVTGGAGFIGSHLVERLVAERNEVVVVDNFTTGKKENLKESMSKICLIEGDIRDRSLVTKLTQNVDVIFHLAANASVPRSVKDPIYDFEANVIGTFNLLASVMNCKLQKFIYASSAAVYGEYGSVPIEESFPLNPVSPYGSSKLCGEILGLSFKRTYGVPFTISRIFNVYGPRMQRYVMHDFYVKLTKNRDALEVIGDGEQTRQFCYISDAVDALLLIMEKGEDVYNLAGNETISIKKVAETMVSSLAAGAKITYIGRSWQGDIKHLMADITELKKLGFRPKVNIDRGVNSLIEWFKKNSVAQEIVSI